MKEVDISKINSIYLPDSTFDKVVEHLEIMNSWKNNPDLLLRFPSLNREFTLAESLCDLLIKGVF